MGLLSRDNWLDYADRSYRQIKDSILSKMQVRVPEITDHSESNLYVKMVSIWSSIAEMLGYYTDNMARESFIGTCRLYKSAVQIAAAQDYRIRAYNAASVTLRFTLNEAAGEDITILAGTVVSNADESIKFQTTEDGVIETGETTISIPATQTESVSDFVIGNSTGAENEVSVLDDQIVDGTILLKVANVAWTNQDTLAFSGSLDEHYTMSVNEDKKVIVKTGNGASGKIPTVGAELKVDYKKTLGAEGNSEAFTLVNIVSDLTLPEGIEISCTNPVKASGGLGVEDLVTLKKNIPLARRTKYRAVTPQDFIDIAELAPGVSKADMSYIGNVVTLFVVPEGGGIASDVLLESVETFFDLKKILGPRIVAVGAGEVRMVITADIRVKAGYNRAITLAKVKDNLVEFLSYENQDINGRVEISDIYQVIENTEGVQSSKIIRMTPVPYARPLQSGTPALNWVRTVNPSSNETVRWKVTMLSSTTFELFRENVFIGQFNTGAQIVQPELTFTVSTNSYSVNDSWEFVTYKYSGTVQLEESSIPVSLLTDIVLNGEGGLE